MALYSSTSPTAMAWDMRLRSSFTVAGRVVLVSLASLRGEDGGPRFEVQWFPGPPLRMLSTDFQQFDAGKRAAEIAIRTHLATLGSA